MFLFFMPMDTTYMEAGLIVKPHGLKGEVWVNVLIAEILKGKKGVPKIFILSDGMYLPYLTEAWSIANNKHIVVKLKGVDTPEAAATVSSRPFYVSLEDMPKPDKRGYYAAQLTGYLLKDDTKGDVGTITEVQQMPGQDVLVVLYQGIEALIPLHPDIVYKVDTVARVAYAALPDGLLDVYTSATEGEKE